MAMRKLMAPVNRITGVSLFFVFTVLTLLAGCGGSARPDPPAPSAPAPLSAGNVNLIFVVSEDLAYQASGDVNPKTANLTNQGLQRTLLMGSFLQQHVLGNENVTGIYALEPMTHLQTASQYPDMVALQTVQQFALLNQITVSFEGVPYSGNNYPLNASYGPGSVPDGVALPTPTLPCPDCQGLDFKDQQNNNEILVRGIVKANRPGFYVFSAPWETASSLLAKINQQKRYDLPIPSSYAGPNYVYAISITPSGIATLVTYNSSLNPLSTYPVLPAPPLVAAPCRNQKHFNIIVTGGQGGAVVPAGINTSETVHLVRHADAHPSPYFSDGNYVAAGQWRALNLPNALRGKINPQVVYSLDPAQVTPGSTSPWDGTNWSHGTPAMTAEPYAIANNLPYFLVTSFLLSDKDSPQRTSDFFFNGGKFSNQRVMLTWEHDHYPPTVNALLATYHADVQPAPDWPDTDYDTIWTVILDAHGNLTLNNTMCQGISSAALPATPPQF
jgi:hypothetical protein